MSWLQRCLETHHTCNQAASQVRPERILPTRLLDVFLSEHATRIVTNFTGHIEYSTLSHCWGRTPIIQTTRSLLKQYEETIPLSDLSRTFREAILVCRSLRIQFLWIDSLCIVQDDPLDWERESVRMADVYSGSYLNLAAAAAADGTEGLFFQRLECIEVRCKLSTGEQDEVFISNSPSNYFMDSRESPLASRAWALQEKVLPPRTLIFGKDQLHWECHEELKSESSRKNMQIDQSFSSSLRRYLSSKPQANEGISAQCKLWYKMLEAYTRCDLTKSEDKLPAIAGLSNAFSRRSGFKYIAGLWEEDLEMGLLWRSLYPKETQLPPSYRAPTWSWAALDTEV
ncbi:HET-domain-containing protein, partial [Stipitochalara longipes BDJ]